MAATHAVRMAIKVCWERSFTCLEDHELPDVATLEVPCTCALCISICLEYPSQSGRSETSH